MVDCLENMPHNVVLSSLKEKGTRKCKQTLLKILCRYCSVRKGFSWCLLARARDVKSFPGCLVTRLIQLDTSAFARLGDNGRKDVTKTYDLIGESSFASPLPKCLFKWKKESTKVLQNLQKLELKNTDGTLEASPLPWRPAARIRWIYLRYI